MAVFTTHCAVSWAISQIRRLHFLDSMMIPWGATANWWNILNALSCLIAWIACTAGDLWTILCTRWQRRAAHRLWVSIRLKLRWLNKVKIFRYHLGIIEFIKEAPVLVFKHILLLNLLQIVTFIKFLNSLFVIIKSKDNASDIVKWTRGSWLFKYHFNTLCNCLVDSEGCAPSVFRVASSWIDAKFPACIVSRF